MRRLEIDNVEVMLEKEVTKEGRVLGLGDWVGKKVLIIISEGDGI